MKRVEWHLSGQPGLNSWENVSGNGEGFLSWGYSTGVDTRYPGVVQLAPLITSLDFTAQQDTPTNTRSIVFSEGITTDTAELAVFACGERLVAVRLDTMAVTATSSQAAYSSAVTDLEYTKNAAGTQEISVCLASNIYEVVTAFNDGTANYTSSANNESIINRFIFKGQSYEADGQVYGLGQASNVENIVRHNVLTGTVAQDASAWVTRVRMSGLNLTFTGGALDGPFTIIGTNYGPYRYNNEHFTFEPMLPELANNPSSNLCKGMRPWSKMGVVIPLEDEVRLSVGLDMKSIGAERFATNNSPVQGRVTAQGYSNRWGLWAYYNPVDDRTYMCFVRPRQPHEYHGEPVSIYPVARLGSGVECEAIEYAGTKGGAANPRWIIGQDDDAGWFIEPRHGYGPSDTNQTYATGGTIYLTEVMRDAGVDKSPRAIAVRTDGCSSTETITFTLTWTDKFGASQSVALPAITEDGFHMLKVPPEKEFWSEAFAVEVAFARGGTTTATPRIIRYGRTDVKLWYETRPAKDRQNRELPQ